MNYSMIRYIIASVLKLEGVFLLIPCGIALYHGESSARAFIIVMALSLGLGILFSLKRPVNDTIYAREGFLSVSLCWVLLSVVGALPYLISGEITSIPDALFESVSGFSTTGGSILSDVTALSKATLFWRSLTHWIGGMGVLVLILTVLPMVGGQHIYLMRAETPGPSVRKLVPRVKHTARILYGIYIGMTLIEIIILFFSGMSAFDSVSIAISTAGTGGFGTLNDSMGSYPEHLQIIVTVFMLLFGINFNIYYLLLCKRFKQVFKSEELFAYLGIIAISILLVAYNIRDFFPTVQEAIQQSAFQVASIITSTGYFTTDYGQWPAFAQAILILLMFIGACAGSTSGGIKVSRFLIAFKTIRKELFFIIHPKSIKKVKMDGHVIARDTIRSVNIFFLTYMAIFVISLLCISLDNFDFTTNFTAVASSMNNMGPGLGLVGPTGNFSIYSDFSKAVLMFDMLVGRLEIFPILILFMPNTWKRQ
ncbi:MAG: TrkH family potassium uptake protein [Lachnospiraceae bacterium]